MSLTHCNYPNVRLDFGGEEASMGCVQTSEPSAKLSTVRICHRTVLHVHCAKLIKHGGGRVCQGQGSTYCFAYPGFSKP